MGVAATGTLIIIIFLRDMRKKKSPEEVVGGGGGGEGEGTKVLFLRENCVGNLDLKKFNSPCLKIVGVWLLNVMTLGLSGWVWYQRHSLP